MIKILNIHQKQEWKDLVKKSYNYDFYHTYDYHFIATEGKPIMFIYQEADNFIAFPLLKRAIPNSFFYDLTSVYGYSGPLSNLPFTKLSDKMMKNFKSKFINYLLENNYVSIFSRLHPYFNQLPLMTHFDGICDNGKTAVIDLQESLEKQRSRYQKGLLNKIERLRRLGFYVKEDSSTKGIQQFVKIYTENMERVDASSFYRFNEEYIGRLFNAHDFDCKLFFVYYEDEPVCSTIVAYTKEIVQSFLMGTANKFLKYSPAKLMNDEISIIGRKLGMNYFNLGGGVGFKEDTLFYFKASFTDQILNFKSWRFVVNQKQYDLLSANVMANDDVDFFPIYRYQNKTVETKNFQPLQASAFVN